MMEPQRILCLLAAGFALLAFCPRPAQAKTGGTYYTDADIAAIRARAARPDYRKELDAILKKAEVLAGRSDEEIWQLIPEADVPRALNVCFGVGCPVHGAEVFKVGGHYPWIMSPDRPFKVQCPVGKEFYPSNDFEAYLKGGRAENGIRDIGVTGVQTCALPIYGQRYWFAGFYVFWEHWRHTIIDGLAACYQAYLATGEPRYAHKCAVALARISQVYPKMDYATQAYHNGRYPAAINGRILDYIWENSTVSAFAMAYDAIFSTLETDSELKALAGSKGVPDVRKAIERDLLQVAVSDIFQKKIWGNKFELGSLSTIALALDNNDSADGATTDEMLDWLLKGGGELEFTLYNGFDRDGIGGESSPSYSAIWNDRYMAAAENLARMGRDIVTDPRWLRIARGPSEMRLLENLSPRLGDCGGDII